MNLERVILGIDGEQIVCEFSLREVNTIIIHGGGTSELNRFYKIAEAVYNRGAGVVLFNFSGHGESSGKLEDQSLERRRRQATDVIKQLVPEGKMYLLGFSMGAQALCDILPEFAERTEAVLTITFATIAAKLLLLLAPTTRLSPKALLAYSGELLKI